jgi:hypothetical protein
MKDAGTVGIEECQSIVRALTLIANLARSLAQQPTELEQCEEWKFLFQILSQNAFRSRFVRFALDSSRWFVVFSLESLLAGCLARHLICLL